MDKEIEFRGWDIEWDKWVYGYYEKISVGIGQPREYIHVFMDWGLSTRRRIMPDSVGQWTGKYDINENKVYNGDRVLHKYRAENGRHESETIIGSDDCPFIDCGYLWEVDDWGDQYVEVLGNEYEDSKNKK